MVETTRKKLFPKNDELRFCLDCGKERCSYGWCKNCETSYMISHFKTWTSDNEYIDKLIQRTQLNATQTCDYLEYIDFSQFDMITYISKGGFSTIYKAKWLEGPRWNWDEDDQGWERSGPINVALKRLDNSQNIHLDFLVQIEDHYKCLQSGYLADCFGITRDPTGCIMFVMRFYDNGNIYEFLDKVKGIITWRDIIDMLWGVASGLDKIHSEKKFHSNLHGGNLLIEDETISTDARIADVGLHGPCNEPHSNAQLYGVLPFVAPEVLCGQQPNQTSDIYSFGIIMWTLASGLRPWYDRPHDFELARLICHEGLRPDIDELIKDIPNLYRELMERCWDPNPSNRPTALELNNLLGKWIICICDDPNPSPISEEFFNAEERRWDLIGNQLNNNNFSKVIVHHDAVYTSRLLYFPELKNS
ncbi:kinase-like domain-containing protein [Gigaspora rosea]|uniref:Kinase-like domain-containing protein n=1 Tax=Gigaspora rosea TaxID=44941 RepID=A0A397UU16_9GLOM|nr:kinase-like domain-containing protein [Gigaspora rosea]